MESSIGGGGGRLGNGGWPVAALRNALEAEQTRTLIRIVLKDRDREGNGAYGAGSFGSAPARNMDQEGPAGRPHDQCWRGVSMRERQE